MSIILTISAVWALYILYNEINRIRCLQKAARYSKETSAEIVFVLDSSLQIAGIKKYNIKISPTAPEEMIGAELWEIFPPEIIWKILEGYKGAIYENTIITRSFKSDYNDSRRLEGKFIPLNNEYVVCLLEDVTSNYTVENVTSPQEKYLKVLAD